MQSQMVVQFRDTHISEETYRGAGGRGRGKGKRGCTELIPKVSQSISFVFS